MVGQTYNKPNVESTELGPNNKEHAKRLLGVLDLGQEVGSKAEGKGNLGWLVKVSLEDVPVKQYGLSMSDG
jgi:hypothetical protein